MALEGEVDVEECGDGLDGRRVLGVVQEVALAGLVLGVPVEDVELGVVGPGGRGLLLGGCGGGRVGRVREGGGMQELGGGGGAGVRAGGVHGPKGEVGEGYLRGFDYGCVERGKMAMGGYR